MYVANVRHTVADRPRQLAAGIALLLLAALGVGRAGAQDWSQDGSQARWRNPLPVDRAGSVSQGPVQVSVRVNGRGIPLYQNADRQDRWYIEAKEAATTGAEGARTADAITR